MGIISVDISNPKNFEKKSYDPIPPPPGKYVCEVSNNLIIEDSKSSANKIVKIELVILDDGEHKGRKIFDNLVIGATPEVAKKTEWKIAHFALSCGLNKDELTEIDLGRFQGLTCEVKVGVETSIYDGETRKKNVVKQYLFEEPAEETK